MNIYIEIKYLKFGGLIRFSHRYYIVDLEELERRPFEIIRIVPKRGVSLHRRASIIYELDDGLYENSYRNVSRHSYEISFLYTAGDYVDRYYIVPPKHEDSKILGETLVGGKRFVFSKSDKDYHLDMMLERGRYLRLFSLIKERSS